MYIVQCVDIEEVLIKYKCVHCMLSIVYAFKCWPSMVVSFLIVNGVCKMNSVAFITPPILSNQINEMGLKNGMIK